MMLTFVYPDGYSQLGQWTADRDPVPGEEIETPLYFMGSRFHVNSYNPDTRTVLLEETPDV